MYILYDWAITDEGKDSHAALENGSRLLIGNGYMVKCGAESTAVR